MKGWMAQGKGLGGALTYPWCRQHLPGLVQAHPLHPHHSCLYDHYFTCGKEEASGGEMAHPGPISTSRWTQVTEAGAPKKQRM